jgi:hypothetical protein
MADRTSKALPLLCILAMLAVTRCDSVSEPAEAFTCSGKKVCREMTSCREARFYLTECGVNSLDGDRDGVPCEVEHCGK